MKLLEERINEKQNELINLKSQSSRHQVPLYNYILNLITFMCLILQDKCTELKADIKKWKNVCQKALERLYDNAREKQSENVSMGQVLASLGIPGELVDYSVDTDWFLNSD